LDPLLDRSDLLGSERTLRWHLSGGDFLVEQTVVQFSGNERWAGLPTSDGRITAAQVELRLLLFAVVALEALLSQDRLDLLPEKSPIGANRGIVYGDQAGQDQNERTE
jgi:hypothetical protein